MFSSSRCTIEMPSTAIVAAMKAGRIQVGVVNEPLVTQGIRDSIWGEPIYAVPVELGPYAWATVNVRADTITHQPGLLERLVRALGKGLNATYSDPLASVGVAKQEFPTMAVAGSDCSGKALPRRSSVEQGRLYRARRLDDGAKRGAQRGPAQAGGGLRGGDRHAIRKALSPARMSKLQSVPFHSSTAEFRAGSDTPSA